MIVYLDTNVFVKHVVDGTGSDGARAWLDKARLAISSVVTFPESCAALRRRARRDPPAERRLESWLASPETRWQRTTSPRVAVRAVGRLAVEHSLRGTHAEHLGAAVTLREAAGTRSPGSEVVRRLRRAAARGRRREGFATLGGRLD